LPNSVSSVFFRWPESTNSVIRVTRTKSVIWLFGYLGLRWPK
jgi:hypothetical protein